MAILGIKMSVFCFLLSVWGIVMLSAMGGLLALRSVAFAEDFEAHTLEEVYEKYDNAVSCRELPSRTIDPLSRAGKKLLDSLWYLWSNSHLLMASVVLEHQKLMHCKPRAVGDHSNESQLPVVKKVRCDLVQPKFLPK